MPLQTVLMPHVWCPVMDFILEEELVDLFTYCLQNSNSDLVEQKNRITEIGGEIYANGGVDAMENFFFTVRNRVMGEIEKDPQPFRVLWKSVTREWNV